MQCTLFCTQGACILILDHTDEVQMMSISELAEACHVGEATITRFCKRFHSRGYTALKIELVKLSHPSYEPFLDSQESETMTDSTVHQNVGGMLYGEYSAAMKQTAELLKKEQVIRAVEVLSQAEIVYCMGQGGSMLMADAVIAKLKGNVLLTVEDVQALEKALWSEVGTKQDYVAEYGQKPLGEFVREIVGLDMNAAKEAFAQYLNDATLDSRQIYFVNQIVEYIVHNGMMKDLSVLQEAPFTDYGSIVEVFTDLSVWAGIRQAIERINANAAA